MSTSNVINQPSIALCMIVKGTDDEAEHLARCLGSVNGYVDAIYLNINHQPGVSVAKSVLDVADRFGATYEVTEWNDNFVDAREKSFALVPKDTDWVMWLDTDDTVDKPEAIKDVIAVASSRQQGIYAKYDYDHDEFGNVTVTHYVARIVRNNGSYVWKSSINDGGASVHETLNEVIPRAKALCNDFAVVHHADPIRRAESLNRNIELLEKMYDRQQENSELDPRTVFYLATHYYDARRYQETLKLLQVYLQLSGWKEERCEARIYIGNILRLYKKNAEAKEEYLKAIGEFQNSPRPYVELSELEYEDRDFEESLGWIEKCLALPKATTTMVLRPMESTFKAYLLGAQASANLGGKKLDQAREYVQKALKLRPLDPDAQAARELVDDLIDNREDIRAATRILRKFEEDNQQEKILPFLDALPQSVQDNPLVLSKRHQFAEVKKWPKKSIAIYVGQGPLGVWGPWSLEEGIGGSEEAVIRLSRDLADLGWDVTIFATPGERAGDYSISVAGAKIIWKQYYELNPNDEYDVLIAWRNPAFFDGSFKARKKYLWLHDLMDKEEFLPERLANLDKVIFVGQYHADFYKGIIPEDKWFVSGNGIDVADFVAADKKKLKRKKHRMVYMSAHNRGLKILLDNWDTIKKAVPDATLDIYYGWQSFDAINRDNPERMAWKDELVKQIEEADGVTDHGRIAQDQIIKEIYTAEVLAYPCIFPEVYCITYVKAAAGKLTTVTSDYAELNHYLGGYKAHYEYGELQQFIKDYIELLIEALKEGPNQVNLQNVADFTRREFSWSHTAQQWSDEME